MKEKKEQTNEKKMHAKKLSYIAVSVMAVMGVAGSIITFRMLQANLSKLGDAPVALPTAPPVLSVPLLSESALAEEQKPEHTPTQAPPEEEVVETGLFKQPEVLEIIMPAEGEILVPYSMEKLIKSKTLGDWRVHHGIDIKTEPGAKVLAAQDGVVEETYEDALMGHTIVLSHGERFQTIYQNLASTQMVQAGQSVTKGECIAVVGNSAASELLEDTHLHFAVKENGVYQNPEAFLKE